MSPGLVPYKWASQSSEIRRHETCGSNANFKFFRAIESSMNLREHAEIAVLVSQLILPSPADSATGSEHALEQYWNRLRYLEHLWSKALTMAGQQHDQSMQTLLVEEMLVCRLLTQVVAAASLSLPAWQQHHRQVDQFLNFADQGSAVPTSRSRLLKLSRRMERWGDFLISQAPQGDPFAIDPARCQDFRSQHRLPREAVWTLILSGIRHAIPAHQITDSARAAVHRLLQEAALSHISLRLFLADGRIKPRLMRRIEGGSTA